MTQEELVADGLLTIREAMDFLSISRSGLEKLIKQGAFPVVVLATARRIPRRAVVTYAAGRLMMPCGHDQTYPDPA
jgi:excisionase family DNA binding protein